MIKYQGISTLEVLSEAKNYNRWIADEISSHLNPPVLEVGAGTGNLTSYLLKKYPFFISDKDKGLVKHLKKKFEKSKELIIEEFDVTKNPPKKYLNCFSTVFGINMLEHVEDDEKGLRTIHKILKKNGRIVLLVPAKKIAYTKLDKELGHFRRYEKDELEKKLTSAGFKIDKMYFFNIVGLFSWYVRDKVKTSSINLKPHHIKAFDMIVPFLRIIESKIKIPVGISLIVVAQKI